VGSCSASPCRRRTTARCAGSRGAWSTGSQRRPTARSLACLPSTRPRGLRRGHSAAHSSCRHSGRSSSTTTSTTRTSGRMARPQTTRPRSTMRAARPTSGHRRTGRGCPTCRTGTVIRRGCDALTSTRAWRPWTRLTICAPSRRSVSCSGAGRRRTSRTCRRSRCGSATSTQASRGYACGSRWRCLALRRRSRASSRALGYSLRWTRRAA